MSTELAQIRQLFMLFHGMYGNQFLDKFRTGDIDADGKDKGLLSAQKVWNNDLHKFDFETIRKAVSVCKQRHKTFPPSLPEFVELCRAYRQVQAVKSVPALGMSEEVKAQMREKNRQTLAMLKLGPSERTDWGTGLPALILMCAKAVGNAGYDEAKALLDLESRLMPHTNALRL